MTSVSPQRLNGPTASHVPGMSLGADDGGFVSKLLRLHNTCSQHGGLESRSIRLGPEKAIRPSSYLHKKQTGTDRFQVTHFIRP